MYVDFTFSSMLFACPFLPSLPQSHNTPNRKKKKKPFLEQRKEKETVYKRVLLKDLKNIIKTC
jgi:hypothetical protein